MAEPNLILFYLALTFSTSLMKSINVHHQQDKTIPNPAYTILMRQDKLLVNVIIAFLYEVRPLVLSSKTSKAAWDNLANLYANKSCFRIIGIKETLSSISHGNILVVKYLNGLVD